MIVYAIPALTLPKKDTILQLTSIASPMRCKCTAWFGTQGDAPYDPLPRTALFPSEKCFIELSNAQPAAPQRLGQAPSPSEKRQANFAPFVILFAPFVIFRLVLGLAFAPFVT